MTTRYQVSIGQTARECTPAGGVMTMKVGVQGRILLGPAGGPGQVDIPLYRGEALGPGTQIAGPALIVEPITTLVLYPGSRATVTRFNNYMVDVPA